LPLHQQRSFARKIMPQEKLHQLCIPVAFTRHCKHHPAVSVFAVDSGVPEENDVAQTLTLYQHGRALHAHPK